MCHVWLQKNKQLTDELLEAILFIDYYGSFATFFFFSFLVLVR
jgi:hypothetical protein